MEDKKQEPLCIFHNIWHTTAKEDDTIGKTSQPKHTGSDLNLVKSTSVLMAKLVNSKLQCIST